MNRGLLSRWSPLRRSFLHGLLPHWSPLHRLFLRGACLFLLFFAFAAQGVLAQPQALGRLFHTPTERARLDKDRAQAEPTPAPRYQGLIESSAGRRTLWVDGQPRRMATQDKASLPNRNIIGGAQDELLRGGHIAAHPQK